MSKLGVHIVLGPRGGYRGFLERIAATPDATLVVKGAGDFGGCVEARKILGNRVTTVGRVMTVFDETIGEYVSTDAWNHWPEGGASPTEKARWLYDHLKPKWLQVPAIDIWEIFNEWQSWWDWQADCLIEMMNLAESDGFRVGLFGCSTGTPPAEAYPTIARATRRAKGHGHVLCLHEYAFWTEFLKDSAPHHALRYRTLYQYLLAQGAECPIFLSEIGQGGAGISPEDGAMADLAWYDSELMKDPYVIGATIFTLGNWGGIGPSVEVRLPELAEYIATHATPSTPAYRVYLPLVARETLNAQSISPGAIAAALALGAAGWLLKRRIASRQARG